MHTTSPQAWDPSALAAALRYLRDRGYTATELADLANISRSQMSRWASGGHRPSYDSLRTLTSALLKQHPGVEYRLLVYNLCVAAGYPEVATDLDPEALYAPATSEDDAEEEMTSPYSGAVWRIVRNLEQRAEDAGLTEEEERAMIERAMEEAEKQAGLVADSELVRRLRGQQGDV